MKKKRDLKNKPKKRTTKSKTRAHECLNDIWEQCPAKYKNWANSKNDCDLTYSALAILHAFSSRSAGKRSKKQSKEVDGTLNTLAHTILTLVDARAQQDHNVLNGYVDLLIEKIEILNSNCEKDREHFRQSALYRVNWPVVFSPNSSLSTDAKALNGMLEIGSQFWFNLTPDKGKGGASRHP